MKFFKSIFLYTSLLFLVACGGDNAGNNKPDPPQDPAPKLLSFSDQTIERTLGEGCAQELGSCLEINIKYPKAEGAQDELRKTMNKGLEVKILDISNKYIANRYIARDLKAAADSFARSFEETITDLPDLPQRWALDIDASISHRSEQVISMAITVYANTGGAHPNSELQFINFDTRNGKAVSNTDFIIDKPKLTQLAEVAFRKHWKIEAEVSYKDAGFDFPEDTFALAETMGFSKEGLVLIYNPYEIAPYVTGATELILPYNQLEGIVDRK
ncbi:MAG: DUF3298 and DUF4163 domain-containing protein [Saprospiraceae bacterium]|nr:DUF3298 and DUF4163 domain-containing protein [Saprospiraceae bacterium]